MITGEKNFMFNYLRSKLRLKLHLWEDFPNKYLSHPHRAGIPLLTKEREKRVRLFRFRIL
jgi:hypothetical protein